MRLSLNPGLNRIAAVALLGLALGVAGCSAPTPPAEAPAVPEAAGGLAAASRNIADMKPVAGEVTTRDMGMATARIGGTLVRLNVREGATVGAGQVIGIVRDDRINLQTAGFEAMVRAAEAEAERARADLARTRTLFDRGIYAQAKLDQMAAAARAAEGNLEAARAQRAASAESGAQGAILAPTAGRVLKADVPVGSVVMPGQSIATVTSGPLVVRVQLPEGQARALRVGTRVEMTPNGPGGDVVMAQVAQVYPAVDAGQVVADIDASGLDASLIGRRIGVRLPVGERQAIVIPATYVVSRFGVDYVRLVRRGTVADTPVQIAPGPSVSEVEVLSGLVAGDRIVAPAGTAR